MKLLQRSSFQRIKHENPRSKCVKLIDGVYLFGVFIKQRGTQVQSDCFFEFNYL